MKSVEFVKNKLNELISKNPYIKCTYEFDKFDSTHYVLIRPKDFFNEKTGLFAEEYKILDEFVKLFPNEGLVFISEEDEIKLNAPIYEKEGSYFQLYKFFIKYYNEKLDLLPFIQLDNFKDNSKLFINENIKLDFETETTLKFENNKNNNYFPIERSNVYEDSERNTYDIHSPLAA